MYRYFASKDDMIRAAISESMTEFEMLAADTARAIGAAVIGYVVQSAFSPDDIDIDKYCAGLGALS
jgi:AcrR family transcriptional regulator